LIPVYSHFTLCPFCVFPRMFCDLVVLWLLVLWHASVVVAREWKSNYGEIINFRLVIIGNSLVFSSLCQDCRILFYTPEEELANLVHILIYFVSISFQNIWFSAYFSVKITKKTSHLLNIVFIVPKASWARRQACFFTCVFVVKLTSNFCHVSSKECCLL
jgi:hypothetical protein